MYVTVMSPLCYLYVLPFYRFHLHCVQVHSATFGAFSKGSPWDFAMSAMPRAFIQHSLAWPCFSKPFPKVLYVTTPSASVARLTQPGSGSSANFG